MGILHRIRASYDAGKDDVAAARKLAEKRRQDEIEKAKKMPPIGAAAAAGRLAARAQPVVKAISGAAVAAHTAAAAKAKAHQQAIAEPVLKKAKKGKGKQTAHVQEKRPDPFALSNNLLGGFSLGQQSQGSGKPAKLKPRNRPSYEVDRKFW